MTTNNYPTTLIRVFATIISFIGICMLVAGVAWWIVGGNTSDNDTRSTSSEPVHTPETAPTASFEPEVYVVDANRTNSQLNIFCDGSTRVYFVDGRDSQTVRIVPNSPICEGQRAAGSVVPYG